jgi:Holliday junction resolvase YEN1
MDEQCIKLLHQLFDLMKVHHHRAPGEVEAECARLQQLGIVDAVWSDDCDAFMFGCTTLIKQHKVAGKRVEDHIRVYRASTILERLDFDADSFVLFALLAGGDYDATGLRGCGEKTAKEVVTRKLGLATRIKSLEKKDLPAWRASLA